LSAQPKTLIPKLVVEYDP